MLAQKYEHGFFHNLLLANSLQLLVFLNSLQANGTSIVLFFVATRTNNKWSLNGRCPWVTGADSVDTLVTGAISVDTHKTKATPHFFILKTKSSGVKIAPPMELLALTGSRTSSIELNHVSPAGEIASKSEPGPQTGGLGTTALAIGSTRAALAILEQESSQRDQLIPIFEELRKEVTVIESMLFQFTEKGIDTQDRNLLRQRANTLVTRTSQAALTASKGAGFVKGHPAEHLIRESMFYLVWSCQNLMARVTCAVPILAFGIWVSTASWLAASYLSRTSPVPEAEPRRV